MSTTKKFSATDLFAFVNDVEKAGQMQDLIDVIKHKRSTAMAVAREQWAPGTIATFKGKRGRVHTGVVVRRNPKTIVIDVVDIWSLAGIVTWRVHPTLLREPTAAELQTYNEQLAEHKQSRRNK
jgi:hypothetical protein